MARRQKPEPDLVQKAARALKNPKTASLKTIQRMAALSDDEQYDPEPHRLKSNSGKDAAVSRPAINIIGFL